MWRARSAMTARCTWLPSCRVGRIRYAYMGGVGGRTRLRSWPASTTSSPREPGRSWYGWAPTTGWRGLPRLPSQPRRHDQRDHCSAAARREALPGVTVQVRLSTALPEAGRPRPGRCGVDQRVQPLRPGLAEAGHVPLVRVVVDLRRHHHGSIRRRHDQRRGAPVEQCCDHSGGAGHRRRPFAATAPARPPLVGSNTDASGT